MSQNNLHFKDEMAFQTMNHSSFLKKRKTIDKICTYA